MINRLLIIALLLSLVGCKSYEFKARNKSELAKVCLGEFPPNYEPTHKVTDTIYEPKLVYIEVDCDTIGKIEVPHICEDRIIKDTQYVNDPRQAYLIQNLEGKLELAEEREKQENDLHKERIRELKENHKAEINTLNEELKVDLKLIKSQRNRYLLVLIVLGGAIGFRTLRSFKII